MKTTTKIQTETEIISEVLCNQCGCSCHPQNSDKESNGQPCFYGLIEVSIYGCYFSPALDDMTTYTFSICELCLKKQFATFKIPVLETEYNLG